MGTMSALNYTSTWIDETVLANGRCSKLLRTQLAHHMRLRLYHVHVIMDEIRGLEGKEKTPSLTKAQGPFRRSPLIGLWHKHHLQPRFLAQNIALHWNSKKNRPRLQKIHDEVANGGDAGRAVHELVLDGYSARTANHAATGEWIIYAPLDGRNYYLTLGKHGKENSILRNVTACLREYPQLGSILAFNS